MKRAAILDLLNEVLSGEKNPEEAMQLIGELPYSLSGLYRPLSW